MEYHNPQSIASNQSHERKDDLHANEIHSVENQKSGQLGQNTSFSFRAIGLQNSIKTISDQIPEKAIKTIPRYVRLVLQQWLFRPLLR